MTPISRASVKSTRAHSASRSCLRRSIPTPVLGDAVGYSIPGPEVRLARGSRPYPPPGPPKGGPPYMSVPRLVLCGLEPGPAVALAAGAVLASLGGPRTIRPISIGLDLSLIHISE